MKKISFFHFLKLIIILLLTYNIFAISILYIPATNIKNFLWQWTPYNYKQILYYPNNIRELSLLNKTNRLLIISFLNKNIYKDFIIDYSLQNIINLINYYKLKFYYNFKTEKITT